MFQIDYSYLRPKKARWLERMYNTPFPEKQSLSVWQGKNATMTRIAISQPSTA